MESVAFYCLRRPLREENYALPSRNVVTRVNLFIFFLFVNCRDAETNTRFCISFIPSLRCLYGRLVWRLIRLPEGVPGKKKNRLDI